MSRQSIETTMYSLSDTMPDPIERRADQRLLTLFRVGALTIGDHRELCLIKNLSAGGMLIWVYCALTPGTPVTIELKRGEVIRGTIGWVRGTNAGIAFDTPIDILALLTPGHDSRRPRLPRITVRCGAAVRQGEHNFDFTTRDISQGGTKVAGEHRLIVGEDVTVALPGLPAQAGRVSWRDADCFGISFNRLLALEELVAWLQYQRARMRAAG